MALISIGAVPGVLAGVVTILYRYGDDVEHRVVHGHDHVPGCLGVELRAARDVHERALAERSDRRPRPRFLLLANVCGRF